MLSKQMRVRAQQHRANHAVQQDFTYQFHAQTVEYSIWFTDLNPDIKTIVFLGTVQIGRLPAWIAQDCPEGTAVVQGAPHWLAKDDGSDLAEFMYRFTEDALMNILEVRHAKKLRIIVDSQATPNVLTLLASDQYIAQVGTVVLIQPLGLNPDAFSGTAEERTTLFKKRVAKNFRHQLASLLSDRRLIHNHKQILRTVGYSNAKFDAQYNKGLMCDATKDLQKLHSAGISMGIICGTKDELFPAAEIEAMLRKNHLAIPILLIPGAPHSPLATRHGMKLFNAALAYLES